MIWAKIRVSSRMAWKTICSAIWPSKSSGKGAKLVRREYPTAIGPVDIMAVNAEGEHVAVEIKRHGGIDGVEQLTRYCELLNRDPLLAPVHGIFAAQTITPQAQVLAKDRGFTCLILDYDDMKGTEDDSLRLF